MSAMFVSLDMVASGTEDYVIIERNAKKGLADGSGKVLIPARYEDLGWSDGGSDVSGNVLGYKDEEKWGLISINNKIITPAIYSVLLKGSDNALIAAKKGQFSQKDFYGLIDFSGRSISGFQFMELEEAGDRIIGIYRNGVEYFYGVLDDYGKVAIPFEYQKIERVSNSLFAVRNESKRNAIFSNEGVNLTGFIVDRYEVSGKFIVINSLGKQGVLDSNGSMIFDPHYAEIFIDGNQPKALAISTWEVLNLSGESLKKLEVENMQPFSNESWKVSGRGYQGIMTMDGDMLTNHEISKIDAPKDGVSKFESFGKFGLMRNNGRIIIEPRFDSLIYTDGFVYGKLTQNNETGWIVMDTFAVTKSKKLYEDIRPYQERVFAVKKKGKWGFVNRTGDEIVACVYDEVSTPKGKLVEVKFHGEYGVITLENDWVVLPKKYKVELVGDSVYLLKNPYQNSLHTFKGEMIYFTDYTLKNMNGYLSEMNGDSTLWYLDLGGRIVDQTSPMTVVNFDDGNITIVRRNSRLGAMDNSGKVIIGFDNDYEELLPPSEGYFGIKRNGSYGFVDFNNKLRIANRYEMIKPFQNDLAAIMIRNKWGFIDKDENLVIQPIYDEVESFSNSVSIVTKDGETGLLRPDGKLELPLEYSRIERQSDGKYLVEKDGKLGLYDKLGKQVLFPKFDEISDTGIGFLIIRKDGKYGIIKENGVPLIPPVYDNLIFDKDKGVYLAKTKGLWDMN